MQAAFLSRRAGGFWGSAKAVTGVRVVPPGENQSGSTPGTGLCPLLLFLQSFLGDSGMLKNIEEPFYERKEEKGQNPHKIELPNVMD